MEPIQSIQHAVLYLPQLPALLSLQNTQESKVGNILTCSWTIEFLPARNCLKAFQSKVERDLPLVQET